MFGGFKKRSMEVRKNRRVFVVNKEAIVKMLYLSFLGIYQAKFPYLNVDLIECWHVKNSKDVILIVILSCRECLWIS